MHVFTHIHSIKSPNGDGTITK